MAEVDWGHPAAPRLRMAKPGYDASDLALDERFLTFDSAVPNGLRLLANGVAAAGALANLTVNYPAGPNGPRSRRCKILPVAGANATRPTLAWARRGAGFINYIAGGVTQLAAYQRGYRQCGVTLRTNSILLSPQLAGVDYAYFVFGTDGTAPETTGPNGAILGWHDLHGFGFFQSRPGVDIDAAPLADMMMSSRQNLFQIAETGLVNHAGAATTDPLADPNLASLGPIMGFIDLQGSYPHYPPVIAYAMGNPNQLACSIFWINASRLMVLGLPNTTTPIRIAVVATDPAYQGGTDSTSGIVRVDLTPSLFAISKHNVDVDAAGANDWIMRSDRLTPYLKSFSAVGSFQGSNFYSLPSPPPSGAGAPFNFFILWDPQASEWWCGCGAVAYFDAMYFDNNIGAWNYSGHAPAGWVSNRTLYGWYRPSAWGSAPGFTATMNVSDFT